MSFFTRIKSDAFDALQVEAGILLTTFDPYNPWRLPTNDEILGTTTGGVNPQYNITTQDYGADVDNFPNDVMEMKRKTGQTASLGFTSITFNALNTQWALGAADTTTLANGVKKIVPRKDILLTDFKNIWWVGDKADGGAYAIKLKNALSTGGLNIQTTKSGKGTMQQTITGHVSLQAQDEMPMEFYEIPPQDATITATITQTLDEEITTSITATSIDFGEALTGTLTVATGYEFDEVHITMGGADITDLTGVWDDTTGAISISSVTGNIAITATAKETI